MAALDTEAVQLRQSLQFVSAASARPDTSGTDDPLGSPLRVWIQKVKSLTRFSAKHPELMIPQMDLLREEDWLDVTRNKLQTEADFRAALASLRSIARRRAARDVGDALKAVVKAAEGRPPGSPRDLIPYLPAGFNSDILDRMTVDPLGPIDERHPRMRYVLKEQPVDAWDQPLAFHTFGGWNSPLKARSDLAAVSNAIEAFSSANGASPSTYSDLMGFPGIAEIDEKTGRDLFHAFTNPPEL